ncbi:hypothetical protein LX90_009086 [Lentzea flava]|nr:hypothetical protein [Lentzea flava]
MVVKRGCVPRLRAAARIVRLPHVGGLASIFHAGRRLPPRCTPCGLSAGWIASEIPVRQASRNCTGRCRVVSKGKLLVLSGHSLGRSRGPIDFPATDSRGLPHRRDLRVPPGTAAVLSCHGGARVGRPRGGAGAGPALGAAHVRPVRAARAARRAFLPGVRSGRRPEHRRGDPGDERLSGASPGQPTRWRQPRRWRARVSNRTWSSRTGAWCGSRRGRPRPSAAGSRGCRRSTAGPPTAAVMHLSTVDCTGRGRRCRFLRDRLASGYFHRPRCRRRTGVGRDPSRCRWPRLALRHGRQ